MVQDINLLWISNSEKDIRIALDAGIDWIFLDIETQGKASRQPVGSFISDHSMDDVERLRDVFPGAKFLLRINPLNQTTENEVNRAVSAGIDAIMLPFFKTKREVDEVAALVNGRCKFWLLVETLEACDMVTQDELAGVTIDRIHVGLNDLRLQLGCRFMFAPLLDARVSQVIEYLRCKGSQFGIGGVSTLNSGLLPGRDALLLHRCLGSNAAILSQDFRRAVNASSLAVEIRRLRDHWSALCKPDDSIASRLTSVLDTIQMLETRGI